MLHLTRLSGTMFLLRTVRLFLMLLQVTST
jgi:hypothetical protein